ncbi:unnamed protein product [Rotaria magnacalcarata]|uniref:RNase H type-1 domain-containing protein n=1 Tax=Rotaria magnacalcarata TaxID=392030 RepID=A0A816SLI6_9BILA|nr:unnamed protein product [Rotaria magnacalcarata]CAF2094075.1 unnamed protein product [Rotaria magnacalcarata]CAF3896691.1 unnamed protein product [Rotaria magnacalcarata]CAF3933745.1 unnamed protein product [Rotaria magnacalcarata]
MGNALIIVSTGVCEDECVLTIDWFIVPIIFMLIVISICSIYHVICSIYHVICSIYHVICSIDNVDRQKQPEIITNENKKELSQCEDATTNLSDAISVHFPLIVTIEKIPILHNIGLFSSSTSRTSCVVSVDIYAISTVEINKSIVQLFPLSSIKERKLICYCDGSYSHYKQIGHSGFRDSNGELRVRPYYPRHPKNGSTETEVFAAFLAIQYAKEKRYNTLTIYTDNSKVEQLLTRPKKIDSSNYPHICQIINQYKNNKINNNVINVVRVRGHTSNYEQKTSKTNCEFAKIDRTVRKKNRQCKARWWIRFRGIYYYYWYEPLHYSYST